jgi:hypothetical protein
MAELSEKAGKTWVLALTSVASFMVALDAARRHHCAEHDPARSRCLDRGAGVDRERL